MLLVVAILLLESITMMGEAFQIEKARPLKVTDEFKIKIVRPPLEIIRTAWGTDTLCPGETTNAAYKIRDNTGPSISDGYTTTPYVIDVKYKVTHSDYLQVNILLSRPKGNNTFVDFQLYPEGKFSVNPGEEVILYIQWSLLPNAPIGEMATINVTFEEGEWHPIE